MQLFKKCAQHHQPINHPSSLSCCNFDWVNSQDLMFASGEMRAACFNEIQWYQTHTYIISFYIHIFISETMAPRIGHNDLLIVFAALFSTCFFSTDLVISPPNSPPISTTLTEIIRTIQFNDVQSMQLEKSENCLKVSENALATIMATKCNQYSNRKSPASFSFNDWDSNPPILERSAGSGSFRSTCQPPPIRTYKSWILACYSEHCNIVGSSLRVGLLEIVVNLFSGITETSEIIRTQLTHGVHPKRLPLESSPHFG